MFNILKPSFWFHKRESELSAETVRIEQMGRFNALFNLDPDRIVDAVTQYKAGTLGPLARIIEDFEDRDDKMKACSMKMRASAARCDYSILIAEGYEKDGRARLHQEILQRFWSTVRATDRFKTNERGGIRLLKKQMMDAQSYGFSVHEIVWRPLPNGEIAGEFIRLPLWHFENRTGELRFIPTATGYDGVRMPEGGWMVTTGDGVGVAAAIIAMSKHLAWQDWLLFSERCGIPILHASTGAAKGTPAWEGICAAVRRAARDFRLVTDQGTRLSAIETGHAANIPYPELVDHADRAIAALYRGADLSTISKGDGTGASLQGDETNMLEQDACANLGETLHEQVDRFVIRYATGDETPLARISIDPVDKPDVDSDIKIDNHLANLGVKLSKREALQRYGRSEAESDDDALEPRPATPPDAPTGGFGAFANEESAPDARKGLCMGLKTTPRGSDGQGEGEDNRALLEAFSRDTGPAASAIRELLDDPTPEKAKRLLGELNSLIPEDPALAAVIADAMAGEFAKTERLANVNQPRGKTTPGSTPGSFAPTKGGSTESAKAKAKREKAERQQRHMDQGVKNMSAVLSGKDVRDFMPGFKNAKVNYDHIAFYQGDSQSGYIHIRYHAPDAITGELNHQAMLQGNKIPETIAKGTWYDDGLAIRVVYNDRIVILGKDNDGLRILSAYEAAEKAKSTRTDKRFVRLMNEKEDAE